VLQAAAAAAGGQQYPAGSLYLVATPIGNLADITLRAIHVLSLVDVVACEDTRHSAPLLRHLGIDKPLVALHQHNEHGAAAELVHRLQQGERVAYISDAGTPAVSDPGAVLVEAVRAAGLPSVAVPGASSVLAAISVAGDPHGSGFRFVGFLPAKGQERELVLKRLALERDTQVLFEAPHRIESLCKSIAAVCGSRTVTVCRELTKQFETVATMAANELPGWLDADTNRQRGEFVVVVHAVVSPETDEGAQSRDKVLRTLMAELPLRQAVSLAAQLCDTPRNALYARALELRNEASEGDS
jgi:16S rRNA (cytidine1402-2'-O)-methyltransferase